MRTTIQLETSVRGLRVTCAANLAHVSKARRVNHESFYGMAILGRPYFTGAAFPAFRQRLYGKYLRSQRYCSLSHEARFQNANLLEG